MGSAQFTAYKTEIVSWPYSPLHQGNRVGDLKDTGYEVVDYFYTNGSELPNRGWKADLLRIPRKLLFSLNQDLTVRILGGFSLMVLAK